jgi:hypothetical protein
LRELSLRERNRVDNRAATIDALTEIASYALTHRARLRQLTEVMKSSAGIRLTPDGFNRGS